jgi:protein gp37
MADKSGIEWTDATWNPVRGCSRVSQGCVNCYAEKIAARFSGPGLAYEGLTNDKGRWNGVVRMVPEHLADPLRWQKPRMVFVNSMSDLFHESLTNEQIAAVFGVMAAAPRHTFQVLTKRPARMLEWFQWAAGSDCGCAHTECHFHALLMDDDKGTVHRLSEGTGERPWPLQNVWLGVSVENQQTADERIPLLLECPAAVRWVSYEPALGPVDFTRIDFPGLNLPPTHKFNALEGGGKNTNNPWKLDWIVVGGESGPGARPFSVTWADALIKQARVAGVPVFVKQLGSHPLSLPVGWSLRDRKGGDMAEWMPRLCVRQWPAKYSAALNSSGVSHEPA